MKYLVPLALVASLAAPAAFAGGMTTAVEEPMLAPVAYAPTRVDGNWGGAYVGVQLGYGDIDSNGAGFDGNGALGGVHAGYRADFGSYVGGIELDHDRSKIDLGALPGDELESVTRLKLMGGYDMGRALVYATAGAAHAKATVGGVGLSDTGWLLGAGLDYALNDNWVIGGEVLHHNFDDFDASGVDLDANTVKLKASYRF